MLDTAQRFGGVAAPELAERYGTPLFVIDTDVLDADVARFAAIAREFDVDVAYAAKALFFVALAERLRETPLGLDVCSLGELLIAERARFAPERIVLHGCAKTDEELRAACAGRVGRIVVDNHEELLRLAALAAVGRPLDVVLRINAGIDVQTHAYIRTGGEDSKFGFALAAVPAAVDVLRDAPNLRLIGVHGHLGSQIFESAPYRAFVDVALEQFVRAHRAGLALSVLIAGGGFGVDGRPGAGTPDIRATAGELSAHLAACSAQLGIPVPRLGIEPGRAIVAAAGTSLYCVAAVKDHGARRFAIVDGGIADNPRPALYGAYHHPSLVSRLAIRPMVTTTVCGRACENDQLVIADLPADLRAGDLLGLGTTGAYTFSMASNYNRFARPAVVFAGGGAHRLVVRRESLTDLMRNDLSDG